KWIEKHHGKEPNFGHLRKISFDRFSELPPAEREPWEAQAEEALEASRAQASALLPRSFDRAKFHDIIDKDLDGVLKRGETKANIRLIGVIVHERPDGTLKVERKFSDSLRAFSNNPAVSNLLKVFGEWIEETGGQPVEGCEPTATVYPNYAKENYPALPNYVGWTLEPLQGLVRGSIKGIFAFQGGVGRVMWMEIKANPTKWIQPCRILSILLENWEDPSRFSMEITTTWADFLLACFNKQITDDKTFQFALTPAGTKPIHPDDSEEDSREQVVRDGKLVWMLSFTKTVQRCHQARGPDGMLDIYPKGAIAYADYMAAGKIHPLAICAPPRSWLDLPGANSSTADVAVCSAEVEYWLDLSKFLSDSSKSRPTLLLDRTNVHQYHLPATDPKGIYKSAKSLPILIPSSPQPSAVPSTMHLPLSMCQRNPPPNATIGYYEEFFEDTLDKRLLVHEPSGTLFGGNTGVVCLTRSLLHLYFAFCLARHEFNPLEAFPAGYDTSRLPLQEYNRLCSWMDRLCNELDKSTKILAQTSAERKGGLDHLQPLPRNNTPTASDRPLMGDDSNPVPTGFSALAPSFGPKPRKTRTRSKSKKGKEPAHTAVGNEELMASPEPESEEEEQNYDELDKTPQDDEGDDSWLDTTPPTPLGTEPSDPARETEDSDRLELGLRYGFTGVNSAPEPHSHNAVSSDAWGRKDEVFGKFNDLPDYDPLRFHTPNALIQHIDNITRSCRGAMDEFHRYLDNNPRVSPLIQEDARLLAQAYPKHQVLYEYIFLRRAIWYEAGRVAVNGIFDHEMRLALIFREAAKAQVMAHETVQHGVFPDPDVGPVDLAQAVRSLNKVAAEVRWTFKELRSFQAHGTKWYNDLRGSWLYCGIPTDLSTLLQIVKGLIDWTDDTMGMITTLRLKRQEFWQKHVNLPFEPKHKVTGMRYRFGCTSTKEEPDGLQDAFHHAQELLLKSASPTPSIVGSEAPVEAEATLDTTGAKKTSEPHWPDSDLGLQTIAPIASAPSSAASAASVPLAPPTAPVSSAVSVIPAASAFPGITPEAPALAPTALSIPSNPSAILLPTSSPADPPPAPKGSAIKRKRGDAPEQQLRRSSSRLSALTYATEPDVSASSHHSLTPAME
ncbi:unnamed protein product, partial [Rhizoctonia solani]